MRYAIIDQAVPGAAPANVLSVAETDGDPPPVQAGQGIVCDPPDGVAQGWVIIGGQFTAAIPSSPPPPISGDAIIGAIDKADRAKADPTDFARIAWRDDVPATNAKLARIAKAIGTTADALRQAGAAAS